MLAVGRGEQLKVTTITLSRHPPAPKKHHGVIIAQTVARSLSADRSKEDSKCQEDALLEAVKIEYQRS